MRDLLQRVRHAPERLLHPLRRRKALELLGARPRPKTLLVLCHGNICRSPIAAALLRRELAPLGIDVQSAGFLGFNRPVPPPGLRAGNRHGVDLSGHRSQILTAAVARAAHLIVVMDADQRRLVCERFGRRPGDVLLLGDLDPASAERRTIRDPVDQSSEVFDEVYARIARCVRELVALFRRLS